MQMVINYNTLHLDNPKHLFNWDSGREGASALRLATTKSEFKDGAVQRLKLYHRANLSPLNSTVITICICTISFTYPSFHLNYKKI